LVDSVYRQHEPVIDPEEAQLPEEELQPARGQKHFGYAITISALLPEAETSDNPYFSEPNQSGRYPGGYAGA
jgi:hypothetical protein